MNKILKGITRLGAAGLLVVANFPFALTASAFDGWGDEYAAIQINGNTAINCDDGTIAYDNGVVSFGIDDNLVCEQGTGDNSDMLYTKSDSFTFTFAPEEEKTAFAWDNGSQLDITENSVTLSGLTAGAFHNTDFRFEDNSQSGPTGNTKATVILRGGAGYEEHYTEANFAINTNAEHGPQYYQMRPEDAVEGEHYSQATIGYDSEESDTAVDIWMSALWHLKYIDAIVINGTSYPIPVDYDDQVSYLNNYSHQMVSFEIENVPKADTYDITVKITRNEHDWIGNFLWTADPAQQWERDCYYDEEAHEDVCEYIRDEDGNLVPGRDYIGHSSLALVAFSFTVGTGNYNCSFDDQTCTWWFEGDVDEDDEQIYYDCGPEAELTCDIALPSYIEFDSGSEEYDDGSLVIPAGATLTMRVIPDYGYQVLNVNMADLETNDEGVGEFTFTVPGGAAYFVADVVLTEDIVNSTTDKVSGGSIDLGGDQTTLDHGTARLEVGDVELTDENKAAFAEAAGDYSVKTYLDISLWNITCKGRETCTGSDEDSWNERVRDLNEPATITLQLEDGVDGNEIVIVHEKHDGTYEIIPTIYDPETNTITFTATSFSNYAIASRTITTPDSGIITNTEELSSSSLFLAGVVSLLGAFIVKRGFRS
ncbi:hypothetical protein IJ765_01425 [Candidatus Saccharibacteria bacterium]|nr:hypothetical protein [Candidatus Saccharibacteria bacterium]